MNHHIQEPLRRTAEKHSNESLDQTPEFTVDSSTPMNMMNPRAGLQLVKDEHVSKLSLTPFISPHRKETAKMTVLGFKNKPLSQTYKLTNDNHIMFSPHKMEWKPKDFSLTGLQVAEKKAQPHEQGPDKVDFIEMGRDSLFDRSRDHFKRMKGAKLFSDAQNAGSGDC